MKKRKKKLREGFTTGSAAAAAAKAAVLYLAGRRDTTRVDIPLPVGGRLSIPVVSIEEVTGGAMATVVKDAGDDPDVTHGARIGSTVRLGRDGDPGSVYIQGGLGVGRVTRPGLPVPVGEWAINPVPRQQIRDAVLEGLAEGGLRAAVRVAIQVERGEEIAKKTFNPRLGIVGGISILGTRGTVKPFSNEAYRETITLSMEVARAAGISTIGLSTGGKSEGFLRALRPDLPEVAFIQAGDFFSFSLKNAAKRKFSKILYAAFFGKMVKMAQGHGQTHAARSTIDFELLSSWCALFGMDTAALGGVRGANTAREALGLIRREVRGREILQDITERALLSGRRFAGVRLELHFYLFDFEGEVLCSAKSRGNAELGTRNSER
ncbi:MAG: cobalt-precorrin-5B (C(1))-methyltransferase [Thermodesulfobacteriota bacterium]